MDEYGSKPVETIKEKKKTKIQQFFAVFFGWKGRSSKIKIRNLCYSTMSYLAGVQD